LAMATDGPRASQDRHGGPLRILLSAYACDPNGTSEAATGWNWAVELAQAGHEVTLLTSTRSGAAVDAALAQRPIPRLRTMVVAVAREEELLGGQLGVYAHYLLWQWLAYRRARPVAARHDLVHHLTYGSLQLGSWLGRLPPPFVFGPVGGGPTVPPALRAFLGDTGRREALRSFVSRRLLALDPFAVTAVRNAEVVLVNNAETAAAARALGAGRVAYLSETGLPADWLRPPELARRRDRLELLWVGRLIPRKGALLALAALAAVPRDVPVRLTILGAGPQEAQLVAEVARLGLHDRVLLAGRVPWDSVREHYHGSDALLFTPLRNSAGVQLLEAMGQGLPVIALAHQGAEALVPAGAGVLVPVGDKPATVAGLAAAITRLARHPDDRDGMAREAFAFARTQTWPAKAAQVAPVYAAARKQAGPDAGAAGLGGAVDAGGEHHRRQQ